MSTTKRRQNKKRKQNPADGGNKKPQRGRPRARRVVDYSQFDDAVAKFGYKSTLAVIDLLYDARVTDDENVVKRAVRAAQKHPAFDLLNERLKKAIVAGNESAREELIHRLINSLCTKHAIPRLKRNSNIGTRERRAKVVELRRIIM